MDSQRQDQQREVLTRSGGGICVSDVFSDIPALDAGRVVLRKLSAADIPDVYEYASDPEIDKYVTWDAHKSEADSSAFVEAVLQKYSDKKVAEWGVALKENNRIIGTCGFVWWLPEHSRAEIGYALSRKYRGFGIMTEAVRAVLAFGFGRMKLHRLEARCHVENVRSEKVMLKNAMVFEGVLRDVVCRKGKFKSLKMYSILDSEYFASNNLLKL